jgi:phenylacetate-coenzyme A ligase PaaK-like adenylate-forming protein
LGDGLVRAVTNNTEALGYRYRCARLLSMSRLTTSSFDWPSPADLARWTESAIDVWQGSRLPVHELAARQRRRIEALLNFARRASPFYRDWYADVPQTADVSLTDLPVLDKRTLMREFDRVSTQQAVKRDAVEAFIADPSRLGSLLAGRFAVWTSSGTTGEPGIFVHDTGALAVYDALESQRFRGAGVGPGMMSAWLPGERYAMVAATGGHFAGVATVERMRRSLPWLAPFVRPVSLLQPLAALVRELNGFAPTVLATYPTAAEMLADEQAAGRLQLHLRGLWTGGEYLAPPTRARLRDIFGCSVRNSYGASEFLAIAWECTAERMHVNSDWVILEPVDDRKQPVAAGTRSHSVLLTNLANRVQPLIRYDLGDAITLHRDACPCGAPFPTIAVEGRCDDALVMPLAQGGTASVVPLALATVLEEQAHVHDYQVVQTAPSTLTVRLGGEEAASAAAVRRALRSYFREMGFSDVALQIGRHPPRRDRASGKLRRVVRQVARAVR